VQRAQPTLATFDANVFSAGIPKGPSKGSPVELSETSETSPAAAVLLLSVTISRSLGSDLLLLLPPDMLALSAPGAIATYIARRAAWAQLSVAAATSFVTPALDT